MKYRFVGTCLLTLSLLKGVELELSSSNETSAGSVVDLGDRGSATLNSPNNAHQPRVSTGEVASGGGVILDSVVVGATFHATAAKFSFGDEITPPTQSVRDGSFTLAQARDYWRNEPLRPGEFIRTDTPDLLIPADAESEFYYSRHSGLAYASQAAPTKITWVSKLPNADGDYELLQEVHTISQRSGLERRRLYWTENNANAPLVQVPIGRIREVNLIFNSQLPAEIADDERVIPSGIDENLVTNRTAWFDSQSNSLRAFNKEGQILIEYLGAPIPGTNPVVHEFLGLELLEVRRELTPVITSSWIGDQLLPAELDGSFPENGSDYVPSAINFNANFTAQHFINERVVYHGVNENLIPENVEFYWLEQDDFGIRWPVLRNLYSLEWPTGVSDFTTVFVRPGAGSDPADDGNTFIGLPSAHAPELVYQDDPEGGEASLDPEFRLLVSLDRTDGDGRHRSLVRLSDGANVWYVRVYSGTTEHLLGLDDESGTFDPSNILDTYLEDTALVGSRIEAPSPDLERAGYVDPRFSTYYDIIAYQDPFSGAGTGESNTGAIIPVNDLNGTKMRVWWFKSLSAPEGVSGTFAPLKVPSVVADYTVSFPTGNDEIILASNEGSGILEGEIARSTVYVQNDITLPGYNPNEEHAQILNGIAYALRDDLNVPEVSSKPAVLLSYRAADGLPAMKIFNVVRETEEVTFDYQAEAGKPVAGPYPLPLMPKPIITDDEGLRARSANREITPIVAALPGEAPAHYEDFTFEDRKGEKWLYRAHRPGEDPSAQLVMQFYYKTQLGFAFPDAATGEDLAPEIGTVVPYLRRLDGSEEYVGAPDEKETDSIPVRFTVKWPDAVPELLRAETLALPKFGLPQIRGQRSVQVVYEESRAQTVEPKGSVILHDATREKTFNFINPVTTENFGSLGTDSSPKLSQLPSTIATATSRGKVFFTQLPTHLQERIFFDPQRSEFGTLVLLGEFNDVLAGEDYLDLNVLKGTAGEDTVAALPDSDLQAVFDLCADNDELKASWNRTVLELFTTVDKMVENPNSPGTFIKMEDHPAGVPDGVEASPTFRADELVALEAPPVLSRDPLPDPEDLFFDQAVDSYALTAVGEGTGYVTVVFQNGRAFTPEEEPVSMAIFRVSDSLYRGEVRPITGGNPLSENLTMQFSGDFAADERQYEFEWRRSKPDAVTGSNPAVYEFTHAMLDLPALLPAGWLRESGSVVNLPSELGFVGGDTLTNELPLNGVTGEIDALFVGLSYGLNDTVKFSVNGVTVADTAVQLPADAVPGTIAGNFSDAQAVVRVDARLLKVGAGETNSLSLELATSNTGDFTSEIDVVIGYSTREDLSAVNYTAVDGSVIVQGKKRHLVAGGSGVDVISDNYYIMRYRDLTQPGQVVGPEEGWSQWTRPALAEGWIKRVLAGINPFNQRINDFFEGSVDTNTSLISQAGTRWEGDIALNLDAVQDAGLIEIYETVLGRGMDLSINANSGGIDDSAANDALLLAAGYLNDLYLALGNEAFADASDPTVVFDNQALGALGAGAAAFEDNFRRTSTSRFAFQGQVGSLLDEELGLLRGRDDFLSPSVEVAPVYNRLFWNYTRGIDAGELIYALNYNIRDINSEEARGEQDGKIDAADAALLFPQAHGDAYGHYLTAVKNYYRLLTNANFTWQPRIEAVNVLGQPVSVDFVDERKFATGGSFLARTANQIITLERRKAYRDNNVKGWSNLRDGRTNDQTGTTRDWGVDDWAARGGQGAYFNWVVGNALLPEEDTVNEGIQRIDRQTVPELVGMTTAAENIQQQLDAADRRVNPLNLNENTLAFDISPSDLEEGETHFLQIYQRAMKSLENAQSVFARANDSTRLLRGNENQSNNLAETVIDSERAFNDQLVDIFGLPYSGDIGPGKAFPQGYEGPDLVKYQTISRPFEVFESQEIFGYGGEGDEAEGVRTFSLNLPDNDFLGFVETIGKIDPDNTNRTAAFFGDDYDEYLAFQQIRNSWSNIDDTKRLVEFQLQSHRGPYRFASNNDGVRARLGSIQSALNEVRLAEEQLYEVLRLMEKTRDDAVEDLELIQQAHERRDDLREKQLRRNEAKRIYEYISSGYDLASEFLDIAGDSAKEIAEAGSKSLPTVAGFSNDVAAAARGAILASKVSAALAHDSKEAAVTFAKSLLDNVFSELEADLERKEFELDRRDELLEQALEVKEMYEASFELLQEVDAASVAYHRAVENYRTEFAKGLDVLAEREAFRKRFSAAVQGYRTRDVAFRSFRTEALEEYQRLLDWASHYTFLAAQAYDYETGLLGSEAGADYIGDIIGSRALGIIENGVPQLSASANGDPGLAGLLAKLKQDYDVVQTRLGFNNPETNGTTFSLRREFFRIPDGPEGDIAWQQQLEALVKNDLLADADVAIHALQLGDGDAAPQPGMVLEFPTTIEAGKNFFGKELLAGDSRFTPTSFATKIHSFGVVFDGYQGMRPCQVCANGPGEETHNHDDALSATPYVHLLPTGLDTMRVPQLGNTEALRRWKVEDYAIPLPFDLGNSESSQALTQNLQESFRAPRRHPAFRATDLEEFFFTDFSEDYTSSRLVGRSAWNSRWKLVIPAKELLADEEEGIARFIRSVKDIQLHLKTYSYSGN